ncbi:hypothetical protein BST97_04435 [Nonlabens spongiae]|uniref:Cadherin domain-containing protein n=1 Tax=Nonlabens spongiae TaxID=331648 RepID=A0A1W6MI47_9FLAO|nr:hypothetical protein [Nonlabens spongiae]ARN77288.1 hypothetical protein BST97_04435 [Nonlabens spongiae]
MKSNHSIYALIFFLAISQSVCLANNAFISPFSVDSYGNQGVNEYDTYTSPAATLTGSPAGAVTYSLSGPDAALFSINSNDGVVSMVPRDFDNPQDADGNNLYSVIVTGTDSNSNTAEQFLDVVVFNLCDETENEDMFKLSAPDSLADINGDTATLRISLIDADETPLSATDVIFVTTSGASFTTIISPSGTTNASGIYESVVIGNSIGISQFTAMYDSDNDGTPDAMVPLGSPTAVRVTDNVNNFAVEGMVGIGTETPDPSSIFEVAGTDKGVLIPRVALTGTTDTTTIATPAISLLVYNTSTSGGLSPGFVFWNGSSWENVCAL